jgi:xylose isomerase
VWEFAKASMRTYLILKEKARRFAEDKEIQAILDEIGAKVTKDDHGLAKFTKDGAQKLKAATFDVDTLAKKGLGYERLDQLVIDLLLGVR